MKVVLQRVSEASVKVDERIVGQIDQGYMLLVGITDGDSEVELNWMAEKVTGLRVFPDEEGKMNLSLLDVGGSILVISQFTLYGNTQKGRRPSFVKAAHPDLAIVLFDRFVELLRLKVERVETGIFGAKMAVSLINDGPVTLIIEK